MTFIITAKAQNVTEVVALLGVHTQNHGRLRVVHHHHHAVSVKAIQHGSGLDLLFGRGSIQGCERVNNSSFIRVPGLLLLFFGALHLLVVLADRVFCSRGRAGFGLLAFRRESNLLFVLLCLLLLWLSRRSLFVRFRLFRGLWRSWHLGVCHAGVEATLYTSYHVEPNLVNRAEMRTFTHTKPIRAIARQMTMSTTHEARS
jgi:hypothetical protein